MRSIWLQSKYLAHKRRLALALRGEFNPYPPRPADTHLSPSERHFVDYGSAPLRLSWRNAGITDPRAWQAAARAKLRELMGHRPEHGVPQSRHVTDHPLPGGLRRRSLYLRLGPGHDVPVHLVWRAGRDARRPVMICLHGTNAGVHLAWGENRMPSDPVKIAEGADYAIQAASRGYLAVCIEQACFGERIERHLRRTSADPCIDAANHALLLGRTLLGERTGDVSAVIDWLEAAGPGADFPVDLSRLHVIGNSSGGTTALFAAALDERITGILAGGCVGFIRETIATRNDSSGQNVIPGVLDWLEMDDVVALCAPRPVLLVSGRRDHIWPFAGAERIAQTARAVYEHMGASDALRAVPAEGGHRFYPDIAWPAFDALITAGAQPAPAGRTLSA